MKDISANQILENLNPEILLILDIDSTLLQTFPRNQAIINDFCSEISDTYPDDARALSTIQCRQGDYGYGTALKRHCINFSQNNIQTLLENYWRPRFFSSDYLHHDLPFPGALDFLNSLKAKHQPIQFLTGRHATPMTEGTIKSFTQLHFPFQPEQLILKKDPKQKDEVYKLQYISSQLKEYKKVTIIDNEPMILCELAEHLPEVELIWFKSTHSGRKQPPEKAFRMTSFL